MKKTLTFLSVLIVLIGSLAIVPTAQAQSQEVRQRMAERLPKIDSAKLAGTIGENNQGYLEVRGSGDGDISAIVSSENADRRSVYEAIASKTGTSAESVAKARARQIAERAAPGVWIQSASGEWYKK